MKLWNLCKAFAILICILGCSFAQAAEDALSTFQLIVLKPGPKAPDARKPEMQPTLKQHVDNLYKLGKEGKVVAAGPFLDGGEIQGILVVAASTPEQALEIERSDPGVQAGLFVMEALPFFSAASSFTQPWAEFGKFERVYFGFLLSGPNRSQDEKTAEALQSQHLAYMTTRAREGKLAMAGPFANASERRGIVVYRASDLEAARELAEGDPMVKAGRLKVELHPWQVPVGAIKSSVVQ